jgi:integrase
MSVKIRKKGGKWYVFVHYQGRRKAKCAGTRAAAEQVKRTLEARLALGDLGFLQTGDGEVPTFKNYSERWLKNYVDVERKGSTYRSYEQLLRVHVTPRFGDFRLNAIARDSVREFLTELSKATRVADPETGNLAPRFSRNTLRLIITALRTVLNAAIEDGIIESNPAARIGRFVKSEKDTHKASAMSQSEVDSFLSAVKDVCPGWHPFFLTAVRAGLRRGELLALRWGDIQFGASADDSNRYILVQRNYSLGKFTTPKSGKSRRVDLSRQLRGVLLKVRDDRLLAAFLNGKTSISDELVFPSEAGTPIAPDNIAVRYMNPALERAGLRKFRLHDLRHTFGSLLIQGGASLAYVKDQMGHSSIQITVDTYGHLIPGADIKWIDRLDSETTPQPNATQPQPELIQSDDNVLEVVEKIWLPPRDSNPDMLIQSQLSCR